MHCRLLDSLGLVPLLIEQTDSATKNTEDNHEYDEKHIGHRDN